MVGCFLKSISTVFRLLDILVDIIKQSISCEVYSQTSLCVIFLVKSKFNVDGWEYHYPACVSGTNIIQHTNKSVDECKQLCLAHHSCLAIEYSLGGEDMNKGDCVLNRGNNMGKCNGGANNLELYILQSRGRLLFTHVLNRKQS